MKVRINDGVKFREGFRPFAPSIMHEYGCDYFQDYQESPYEMERTLKYRAEVWDKIPAVVHENHTGRLQKVKREWNPVFYELLEAFYHLSRGSAAPQHEFQRDGKTTHTLRRGRRGALHDARARRSCHRRSDPREGASGRVENGRPLTENRLRRRWLKRFLRRSFQAARPSVHLPD
jgi:hypothetical protein